MRERNPSYKLNFKNMSKKKKQEEFDDEFEDFEDFREEACPMIETIMNSLNELPKPFGMVWHDDLIEKLLTSRGYVIVERNLDNGATIRVAVKKGEDFIPEDMDSSVLSVFEREIQEILIDWLLKLGK